MFLRSIVTVQFLFLFVSVIAQSSHKPEIDSLIKNIPAQMRSNEAVAVKMIDQLGGLSAREKHLHGITQAAFFRCWLTYRNGSADAAIRSIDSALANINAIETDSSLANFYILKGQCYVKKTQFNFAQLAFKRALSIAEQKNDVALRTSTMISIGWAYMEDGKPKEAIGFFETVLKANPAESYPNRALLLCNIAACYNTMGNFTTASTYASRGIALARSQGAMGDLANGLNILAHSFYQQGNTEKAIALLKEASMYRQKIADPSMLASDYLELANLYLKNNQPALAIEWSTKAKDSSLQHSNALKVLAAYELLANAYEVEKDAASSLEFYKKILHLKDSLSDEKYNQSMASMQVEFEAQKKQSENLELKKENLESKLRNASQQRWMILLGSGIVLFLFTGVYLQQRTKNSYRAKIIQQQLLEQKRRARDIMAAEENERSRIAADLHDGVCQTLAVASMQLRNISAEGSPISSVDDLINQAGKDIRDISHKITPELLLKEGLAKAIQRSIANLNVGENKDMFSFIYYEEVPLEDNILSLVIYRCFQELTTNIVKHADAKKAVVQLGIYTDEIQLMAEDDGKGFSNELMQTGLGLQNIRRRISLFSGTLTIDSITQKGTTITISFKDWKNKIFYDAS
ncbi:MAG: hypothetical protein EOO13_07445 [Chitinophagaceae bacterium]|nr:MAG: hypothetical protein EOO13_07445 [Chitinophagaceae bacterium]